MKLHPVLILTAGIGLSIGCLLFCLHDRAEPIPAGTETERQLWLFAQGWKGREISMQEITIPDADDPVFAAYAAMQAEQGLPLERYTGQAAQRYVYELEQSPLYAELLTVDGALVGAMCCDPADHTMRRISGRPYP